MITKSGSELTSKNTADKNSITGAAVVSTGALGKKVYDSVLLPIIRNRNDARWLANHERASYNRQAARWKEDLLKSRKEHINNIRDINNNKYGDKLHKLKMKKGYKDLYKKQFAHIKDNFNHYADLAKKYNINDVYKMHPSLRPTANLKNNVLSVIKNPSTYKSLAGAGAVGALGGLAYTKLRDWKHTT